jgi:hypothetical protein
MKVYLLARLRRPAPRSSWLSQLHHARAPSCGQIGRLRPVYAMARLASMAMRLDPTLRGAHDHSGSFPLQSNIAHGLTRLTRNKKWAQTEASPASASWASVAERPITLPLSCAGSRTMPGIPRCAVGTQRAAPNWPWPPALYNYERCF